MACGEKWRRGAEGRSRGRGELLWVLSGAQVSSAAGRQVNLGSGTGQCRGLLGEEKGRRPDEEFPC